jgi:hypothetical protein
VGVFDTDDGTMAHGKLFARFTEGTLVVKHPKDRVHGMVNIGLPLAVADSCRRCAATSLLVVLHSDRRAAAIDRDRRAGDVARSR